MTLKHGDKAHALDVARESGRGKGRRREEKKGRGGGRRGRQQGGTCDEVRAVGRERLRAVEEGGQWLAIRMPSAHMTWQAAGARSPSLLNKQLWGSLLLAVPPHLALLPQHKPPPSPSCRKRGHRTQLISPGVS